MKRNLCFEVRGASALISVFLHMGTDRTHRKRSSSPYPYPCCLNASRCEDRFGHNAALWPGARWTKKHGKSFYGYKNDVNADAKHKLIRQYDVTDASVHDIQKFDGLLNQAK